MTTSPPPLYHPMVDKNGVVTMPWVLFFGGLQGGDQGTDWTPAFTSLAVTGTPILTGTYFRLSNLLVYFTATVTPATNTSCTAGSTYINNFPLIVAQDSAVVAVSGVLGSNEVGIAQANSGRIYPPTWTNETTPVIISGLIRAQ